MKSHPLLMFYFSLISWNPVRISPLPQISELTTRREPRREKLHQRQPLWLWNITGKMKAWMEQYKQNEQDLPLSSTHQVS